MKHDVPFRASAHVSPNVVTVLHCGPLLQIDPAPLTAIYANQGQERAENTICRVLEDIALRLNVLHTSRCRGAFSDMVRPAGRLASVAVQIGLTEVAKAAEHVATAAAQGDAVALQATMSRLERGFDGAISQIWEVPTAS